MTWYDRLLSIYRLTSILLFIFFLAWVFTSRLFDTKKGKKMPIAVVTNDISDKLPVTSAPPDGYVIVRRMNYGEKLLRSNMAAKFMMSGSSKDKDFQGELDMQTEEVAYWDFANLVVEHNMQDKDGKQLNFANKHDVKKLDGVIGDEIGNLIDGWNEPEKTEEVKNS